MKIQGATAKHLNRSGSFRTHFDRYGSRDTQKRVLQPAGLGPSLRIQLRSRAPSVTQALKVPAVIPHRGRVLPGGERLKLPKWVPLRKPRHRFLHWSALRSRHSIPLLSSSTLSGLAEIQPRLAANSTMVHSRVLTLGLMIPGVCLTGIVLLMYGFLALFPASREKLDRVSLRLLVYALVAHIVFGSNVILMTMKAFSDWRCSLIAFITNLSLQFSGGLFFCVAVNIPLVLARNFDGQKTEKYYVLGTAFVCAVCNGAAYASGALGWNSTERICWYRNANPAETLRWVVGTQTFWMLLISVGEVVAFLIVVGYLCAYAHTARKFRQGSVSHLSADTAGSKIFMYRSTILRIGIYPLMSAVMNMTGALFDLYVARHPRELNLPVKVADLAMFSARPLVYGLLAVTDPSFINAWKALRHRDVPATTSAAPSACLSTVIDMQSIYSDHDDDIYMQSVSFKEASLVDAVAVVNVTVIPPRNGSPDAGLIPGQSGSRDVARHI